jgi:hypothetical protein
MKYKMADTEDAYKILVGKSERKRPCRGHG